MTIDLAAFPAGTLLNIQAITAPTKAGSVLFIEDSSFKNTDNTTPYYAFGDTAELEPPSAFSLGQHTLSVSPYSGSNATGKSGPVTKIAFTVIQSPPPS